uniref:Origin recognition complex subunit 1 n=1 Tax=Anolis carolinensis TaxID=28377 RepID=G1KHI9_ANOCA
MNRRSQRKRIYTWIGKAFSVDKQLQISHYRGIAIKSAESVAVICVFLGEFILIEAEDTDELLVARLIKLYEDGKHAIVEWFSRSVEIPLKHRLLLGQEASHEIFFNENIEQDTSIPVTSIISNVTVIPLSPWETLPAGSNDEKIFFIRKCWDGKRFKPLPPAVLAELKDTVKLKSNNMIFSIECHLTPSRTICPLAAEPEQVLQSIRNDVKNTPEVESRHSASKSSLAKRRYSQRIANGNHTPAVKKKLQLNSPTNSPRSRFAECEIIEVLDSDFIEPLKRSATKRKVTFSGIKCSPSKIPFANDEGDPFLDIKPLEDASERVSGGLWSPCKTNKDDSPKNRHSVVKESRSPALTPRSRRKCARKTAIRIAQQLGYEYILYRKYTFSACSSKRLVYLNVCCVSILKLAVNRYLMQYKRQCADFCGCDISLQPEPRTPKTPRDATPRIRVRNQTTPKPANALEEARVRLHVSAVPESLPCREKEFQDICNFIESKLIDRTGGCMYISGVPGTGKTATVHEVIHYLQQAAENDELPSFQFIEINGMKLTDPHQAYVQILKLLTGQKATANHAAELLEKMFCKSGSKRETIVLVVDELDLLWTRKQNVMYNLFDWPTQKNAKLIVLAIANTMDLPERIMMNRVASRLGLTRMSFQPYTFKQLQKIISSRMGQLKAFEEDAIQLVSRKVAALSGDARRCLDICRRATEICEQKSDSGLVGMAHVMEAIDEMFSSSYIRANLRKATIAEFRQSGLEEATVQQIFHQHVALSRIEGLQTPNLSDTMAIASRLGACRILLCESSHKYLHMRVRLNVSQDDVMYALKEE